MKELYLTESNIINQSQNIINGAEKYSGGRYFNFNPENSILLVTDMQEFFLNSDSHAFVPSASAIVAGICRLIERCLNKEIPVIATQHINTKQNASNMMWWWKRILSEETKMAGIIDKISAFNLPVIKKQQYDAFFQTELDHIMQTHNKSQIIVCGVMTNLCCETTCRSAFVRGYQSFFPVDTTAAYNLDMHQSTFNNMAFGFAEAMLSSGLIEKIEE
jgi:isochorismate hydrolase